MTTLHLAAKCSSGPVVREIVEAGDGIVYINTCDSWNQTPLYYAAKYNDDVNVVQILLSKGADVKAMNKWQRTPLHKAVRNNSNAEVISFLVEAGADVDARDGDKQTPLHWAFSKLQNVNALLEAGATVNLLDKDQCSPLFMAALKNQIETVRTLLDAGADPRLGKSPLDDDDVNDDVKQLIRERLA